MLQHIPKDFVLILSGVQCVGKTTTAYNILKYNPEFRRVSELDIIRTVVRTTIRNTNSLNEKILYQHYWPLFETLSEANLLVAKEQSKLLIPYVKEIVERQQMRKIPTIIEGSSIIPSTYFHNNIPINGFKKNVIFVNLYLSDENEHLKRRINRCKEREYNYSENMTKEQILKIRNNKILMLHLETLELSKNANNVFSIDVANMTQDMMVDKILHIINNYLKTN